jgi:hypothetical protein
MALNTGWWLIDAQLQALGAKQVLQDSCRQHGWLIDSFQILRALVAGRVIDPASKKATIEHLPSMCLAPEVDLDTTYRALDHIAEVSLALQAAAARQVRPAGQNLEVVFYDVTNYFFTVDQNDPGPINHEVARGQASRRRGASKENRKTAIIQMGLFLDATGLPVSYRLFNGNTPDASTLQTALKEFKATFTASRMVVVADKAMNNQTNTGLLAQGGDGWIVSGSARSAGKTTRAWLLDPAGWQTTAWDTHGQPVVKVKTRLTRRNVAWTTPEGVKVHKVVPERLVARWSAHYAARDAANRADMLAKAQSVIDEPSRYKASTRHGVNKYITPQIVDPATGVLHPASGPDVLVIDTDRVDHDAEMDGYWLIHTSETTIPVDQILDRYQELWRIEETFKVSKTDLQARPVYVSTPQHIEAHFTICFLALLITRQLEQQTGLNTNQLLAAIRGATARELGDGVYVLDRPATWDLIDQATGAPLDQETATIEQLRAWRHRLQTSRLPTLH